MEQRELDALNRVKAIVEGREELPTGEDEPTYQCPKCEDRRFILYTRNPAGYPEWYRATYCHPCVACEAGRRLLESTYGEPDLPDGGNDDPRPLGSL